MLDIHNISLNFPKIEQYGGIADQLRRSSKSIVANIVEGFGKQRFYKDEFKRMLVYSIGSCDETMLWIKASKDLGYINSKIYTKYLKEYKILVKKISSFTYNIKNRK
jgi:four helix bundle protein